MACRRTGSGRGVWVVDPISGDKADLKSRNDAEKSCMHMIAYVDIYIYIWLMVWNHGFL